MKLTELSAKFLRRIGGEREIWDCENVTLANADGVQFLCPVCFVKNGGPVGTHSIICWRPRVPAGISPGPGRWEFQGTGLADLSLVAGSSSILLTSGCKAHFHVKRGEIK